MKTLIACFSGAVLALVLYSSLAGGVSHLIA